MSIQQYCGGIFSYLQANLQPIFMLLCKMIESCLVAKEWAICACTHTVHVYVHVGTVGSRLFELQLSVSEHLDVG